MGSAASVFSAWKSHVSNEIKWNKQGKSDKRMRFGNTAPVIKLTNFYIIGDTKGATECFITGHGGSFASQYFIQNRSFTIPSGVTINFYQPDGYELANTLKDLRSGPLTAEGNPGDHIYKAGSQCTNYILSKDQGVALRGDADDAHDWEMDYSSAQQVASDLGVVLVTVRNRWFHAGVTLESAVKDVRSEAKTITLFNCLFCRVNEASGDKAWDAEFGKWV